MNLKIVLISAISLIILASIGCKKTATQTPYFDTQKMDSLFMLLENYDKAMGTVSIYKDGAEIYTKTIGYSSKEDNIKATVSTKYHIGSFSKTFTAVVIMKLIEEGKLSLSTKLNSYYPQIPYADSISIEQMLNHSSGIYNFTDATDYTTWMEKPIIKQDLVTKIAGYTPTFKPRYDTSSYSNGAFALLSFIAEDIDKKSFANIIKDRIATPYNLNSTYFGVPISVQNGEAKSYFRDSTKWVAATTTDMSVPVGAGAIVSTAKQVNEFLTALYHHKNLVSTTSLNSMMTIKNNFGLGMFPLHFKDKTGIGHTGEIDGFRSFNFYFEQEKISIVYLTNGVNYNFNSVVGGILNILFSKEYQLPKF